MALRQRVVETVESEVIITVVVWANEATEATNNAEVRRCLIVFMVVVDNRV